MDQCADRGRTLHGVGQPDVQRELSGLANRTAEDQERDEGGACTKHGEAGTFKTTAAAIVEKQCATAIVEPQQSEKKSHVADAGGDEGFLCGRRGAGSLNPEADEQIRREPDEFPK